MPTRTKAQAIYERAKKVIPAGVNSNFRYWGDDTPIFARAKGPYMWDADGKQYIDYRLGWGPIILGHLDERVVSRVRAVLDTIDVICATTELEVEVAERMTRMVPGLDLVRFANSGTEATMHALRVARAYTNREKVLKFEGQYHGMYDYMLFTTASADPAALGSRRSPVPYQQSSGIPRAIRDYVYTLPFNDVELVETLIKDKWHNLAAIMVEPSLGNCAGLEPHPNFLPALRRLCDEYGVVLIFDEVKTGFRIANGGAREVYGVIPDISTYAKSLGNGFPVAAFGGSRAVMSVLEPGRVSHGGTFTANGVAMAAAGAVLDTLAGEPILANLAKRGRRLQSGLGEILSQHNLPHQITGHPNMPGILLTDRPVNDFRDIVHHDDDLYEAITMGMIERGVFPEPDAREPWFLCDAHSEAIIDETLNVFEDALKAALKTGHA
ncbi:MAG: guanitoxin biosynthesis PLP-dependent transaminase GntE [Anaerolineae bacterium]